MRTIRKIVFTFNYDLKSLDKTFYEISSMKYEEIITTEHNASGQLTSTDIIWLGRK